MSCCNNDIKLDNIVLTKGESSEVFEIFSRESLQDFKAFYRITDGAGVIKFEGELCKTPEVKNTDSIFGDHLTYSLDGVEYENVNHIQEFKVPTPIFNHKIKIDNLEKHELNETVDFTGKVYDVKMIDTIKKKDEITPDEEKYIVEEYTETSTGEIMVILRKNDEVGVPNCEVFATFTSIEKETSRKTNAFTNASGEFSGSLYLGNTIKTESGKGFIFMIPSTVTENLDKGRYVVTVTVQKIDRLDPDEKVLYSKEILQTKLDINEKI